MQVIAMVDLMNYADDLAAFKRLANVPEFKFLQVCRTRGNPDRKPAAIASRSEGVVLITAASAVGNIRRQWSHDGCKSMKGSVERIVAAGVRVHKGLTGQ
jgi:hypothetical protein